MTSKYRQAKALSAIKIGRLRAQTAIGRSSPAVSQSRPPPASRPVSGPVTGRVAGSPMAPAPAATIRRGLAGKWASGWR